MSSSMVRVPTSFAGLKPTWPPPMKSSVPSMKTFLKYERVVRMNVVSRFTYTLETIIQAGQRNMTVVSVPIRVNGDLRPSRLVRSIPNYIKRSMVTPMNDTAIMNRTKAMIAKSTIVCRNSPYLIITGLPVGVGRLIASSLKFTPPRYQAITADGLVLLSSDDGGTLVRETWDTSQEGPPDKQYVVKERTRRYMITSMEKTLVRLEELVSAEAGP